MNLAVTLLIISVVAIVGSLPLIFRMVKMNGVYGIRIPESFRSEARWYEINRFGGILILLWGVIMGIAGAVGLSLDSISGQKYNLISIGILLGGIVIILITIFVYAAMTRKLKLGMRRPALHFWQVPARTLISQSRGLPVHAIREDILTPVSRRFKMSAVDRARKRLFARSLTSGCAKGGGQSESGKNISSANTSWK